MGGFWPRTETTPTPQRRAVCERGRNLTERSRRADSPLRPSARVTLGVRPRIRSWCALYPPARGLGARERHAGGDGRDERNDTKPPMKSGAQTRPRTHRECVACRIFALADRASRSACVRLPARGAPPTRRRGASERGSGARGATDGTNETTPNPQRRAPRERGRGLTVGARHADSQHASRPTACAALGVRLRARSWCAPYPPARGLGARERRARGDGRDERNDCKPPTKNGA